MYISAGETPADRFFFDGRDISDLKIVINVFWRDWLSGNFNIQ